MRGKYSSVVLKYPCFFSASGTRLTVLHLLCTRTVSAPTPAARIAGTFLRTSMIKTVNLESTFSRIVARFNVSANFIGPGVDVLSMRLYFMERGHFCLRTIAPRCWN